MESLFPLSFWVIALLALCLVVLVASLGMGLFLFLFKVGVVIDESRKPPHIDQGNYRLDQGHDVRPELEHGAVVRSSKREE